MTILGGRRRNTTAEHTPAPVTIAPTPPPPAPTLYKPPGIPNPDDTIVPLPLEMLALVDAYAAVAKEGPEAVAFRRDGAVVHRNVAASHRLTRAEFANSSMATVLMSLHGRGKYKYTLEDQDDITFFMVRDNVTVVRHQMDHVLYKRNKFVCINDNMNHSHPNHSAVVGVLQDLFRSYYPLPSSFERRDGRRNDFTRLGDYELRQLYARGPSRSPAVAGPTGDHESSDPTAPLQRALGVLVAAAVVVNLVVLRWLRRRPRR